MTGIRRVERITKFGIFSDFTWDTGKLKDFGKRNLIYGWNYSGKTTFSRIFQAFERPLPNGFKGGIARLRLTDDTVASIPVDQRKDPDLSVRVFNQDYIESNVSWRKDLGVEPILLVGSDSIDLQNKLKVLNVTLDKRRSHVRLIKDRIKEIHSLIDDEGTKVATEVRERYRMTPFNRRPHLERLLPETRQDAESKLLEESGVIKLEGLFNAEQRGRLRKLSTFLNKTLVNEKVVRLLSSTATQEVIERLAKDEAIKSWVEKGIELHAGLYKILCVSHKRTCQARRQTWLARSTTTVSTGIISIN